MHLTLFSDYAMRVLLYAAMQEGRLVTLAQISKAYGISRNHLLKVTQSLVQIGVIESVRGRNGGLRLAMEPKRINMGALVRKTEPDFHLVECFDRETNTCPIAPACDVKGMLGEAQSEFLRVLDGYTLADLLHSRRKLQLLWGERASRRQ